MLKRSRKERKFKEERYIDDVSSIDIKLETRNLTIICGPVLKIINNDPYVCFKAEENVLYVYEKNGRKKDDFDSSLNQTILYIPRGYVLKEFRAKINRGDLIINILKANFIDIEVFNGCVKIDSLHLFESGTIINRLGNIEIESGKMNNLCAISFIGNVKVRGYVEGNNEFDAFKGNLSFVSTRKLEGLSIHAKSDHAIISCQDEEVPELVREGSEDKVNIYTDIGIAVIEYCDLDA